MRDKNFDVNLLKTLNDQPMPETPLTDDEFTRVLDAACGRLPQKKPAGHRRFPWERVAAAAVACLAVGLGSINFAAPAVAEQLPVVGSLFSWLNRGGQDDYVSLQSEQLNKYAETVKSTAETADSPYILTLGQVFNDGDWLRISLMLTSEDDSLAGFNAIGPREDAVEKALQNGGGQYGTLVLDKTPFYAQSGGQVGDSGVIKNGADNAFIVADTAKNADKIFLHRGEVTRGIVSVGDPVQADINAERRRSIMRNHTAAHLLQAALRQVLGTHVEQAGQLVDEREVRFDFTHFNAMTRDELLKVEHLVNAFIMGAHPVESMEMPIDEAKKLGAMMLFGEKYGNIVRVVKAGDFSTEFCGGTHVSNSGQIGLFHIVSEASVASGVRRITALTGSNVLAHIYQADGMLSGAAAMLRSAVHDLPEKLAALADSDKAKDKEIKSLKEELAHLKSADLFAAPVDLDGLAFYTATLTDVAPDALRSMGDELKNKGDNVVAVVAGVNGEKANIVAVCGKEAIARGVKAGDVVREIAKLAGGGGGGRPDSAMAGCKNVDKLPDAMAQAAALVRDMIQ